MTELKTEAAEQALDEHLAATRKDAEPKYQTLYSGTPRQFRASLVQSAARLEKHWQANTAVVSAYVEARKADPGAPRPAESAWDAMEAGLLGSMYAYALAAVLGVAAKDGGEELGARLAHIADDILMNGDFEDRNGDVREAGETAPGITQGLAITLPAPDAEVPRA